MDVLEEVTEGYKNRYNVMIREKVSASLNTAKKLEAQETNGLTMWFHNPIPTTVESNRVISSEALLSTITRIAAKMILLKR